MSERKNRLGTETSPYLQQHKDNPIHWFPYSEEAFAVAKNENKPIFLSIGYSSCHWCHVMARESFSDAETAEYMNTNFICVKMDREEFPGIDKAYQEMYQLVNRRGGGWPLSVYAMPDGAPFLLATYIPKESKYGMKSFMTVNREIIDAWTNKQDEIVTQANAIMDGLNQYVDYVKDNPHNLTLSDDLMINQVMALMRKFDHKFGGVGPAPKFPRISTMRFLLQEGKNRNRDDLVEFVRFTYHKMARGGIYDQVGGGFSRYSVDVKWLVPHFEKMAYDNAGFILLGAELYAVTGDTFVKWVVYDTIAWIARDLRSKYGGFYSSINAESEGMEGKFYVWQREELREILGDDFHIAEMRFGISRNGNFKDPHHPELKGMNVLSIKMEIKEIAEKLGIEQDMVINKLNNIRQVLFETRSRRVHPSRDTKLVTSWNALMIQALLVCSDYLDLEDAGKMATDALDFLLETMLREDRVIHSYHDAIDEQVYHEIDGNLDDYATLIQALIQAYEYSDSWKYIEHAIKIEKLATNYFYSDSDSAYFVNRKKDGGLFNRVIQVSDESMISGFAVMVGNLFKLGKYTENTELIERGEKAVEQYIGGSGNFPGSMNGFMLSANYYLNYPTELVLVNANRELDNSFIRTYMPQRLIYRWNEGNKNDGRPFWEVLENRVQVDQATAYICRGMTCSLPLTSNEAILRELKT